VKEIGTDIKQLKIIYGANAIQQQIDVFKNEAKSVVKRADPESVHRIRVASRKLKNLFDLFQDQLPLQNRENWRKESKRIEKLFGKVRDLDIHIQTLNNHYKKIPNRKIRKGVRRVRLRLCQLRQQKQPRVRSWTKDLPDREQIVALTNWVENALDRDIPIKHFQQSEMFQFAYYHIQKQLNKMLFFEVFLFDQSKTKELHKMRIAARKLRYTLEALAGLYGKEVDFAVDSVKNIEQNLGRIHDADVWIKFLPKFLTEERNRIKNFYGYHNPYMRIEPGIKYLLDNIKKGRVHQYQSFIDDWKTWKREEIWMELRKKIFLACIEPSMQG